MSKYVNRYERPMSVKTDYDLGGTAALWVESKTGALTSGSECQLVNRRDKVLVKREKTTMAPRLPSSAIGLLNMV